MQEKEYIQVRGAKANNLQNIDVDIPRGEFVVVTGLSGSGKSSLAFDTIYAEGQRRYMDTLSTYAKHFMGILEKPEVEEIRGLSPIIAIEQKTTGNNPRSTVGTITEIYDFLRLLYAKGSRAISPESGEEMVRYTDGQIVDLILTSYRDRKCYLLAPLVRGRKGHYRELFDQLRKRGYTEVRIDGEILELQGVQALDRYKPHFIELVVDRLKPGAGDDKRVRDSVGQAISVGKGSVAVMDLETAHVLLQFAAGLLPALQGPRHHRGRECRYHHPGPHQVHRRRGHRPAGEGPREPEVRHRPVHRPEIRFQPVRTHRHSPGRGGHAARVRLRRTVPGGRRRPVRDGGLGRRDRPYRGYHRMPRLPRHPPVQGSPLFPDRRKDHRRGGRNGDERAAQVAGRHPRRLQPAGTERVPRHPERTARAGPVHAGRGP